MRYSREMHAGFAQIDITPSWPTPLAGNGWEGLVAHNKGKSLRAKILALGDDSQVKSIICVVDLMSCTRPIFDRVCELVSKYNITPSQIVIVGTHTHHGPGGHYGSSLYQFLASARPGYSKKTVDFLSHRIAQAIDIATRHRTEVDLYYGSAPLWGVSRNASIAAFKSNPEANNWARPNYPAHNPPTDLSFEQQCVDPRIRTLIFRHKRSQQTLGVLGLFGCHATALGVNYDCYHPDWPGVACELVENHFGPESSAGQEFAPWVALAIGPSGDTNCMRINTPQGLDHCEATGQRVASGIIDSIHSAKKDDCDTVSSQFIDLPVLPPYQRENPSMPTEWIYGAAALGGAEDGRSVFYRLGLIREGMTSRAFPFEHPQSPKSPALGFLQRALRELLELAPPTHWPIHTVQLGSQALVSIPLEPSTIAAYRIEQVAIKTLRTPAAWVLGYGGDYAGYLTTAEEYRRQAYEGASTLYGRNSLEYLCWAINEFNQKARR